ncbi:MAG: hypothetical protein JKY94_09980 [Rhodobacteraceae bacterium]|nr:hypothetical protein [Paracoccaceae bacterium]
MKQLNRIVTFAVPTVLLCIAAVQTAVDPRLLMLDPLVAAEISDKCCSVYFGIISTIGIMGWIATTAICAFTAYFLYVYGAPKQAFYFSLSASMFTGFLAFDDAFLFHEVVAPRLGISQNSVLGAYVGVAGIYCLLAWRFILLSDMVLFVAAGLFLATSMGLDVVLHSTDTRIVFLEDGTKFIGIFCWLGFHTSAMTKLLGEYVIEKKARLAPS